jgi:hypothetical protein
VCAWEGDCPCLFIFNPAAATGVSAPSLLSTSAILLVCQCSYPNSELSNAVLSSQQTPLQQNISKALQLRDAASQRFLQLHQQVPSHHSTTIHPSAHIYPPSPPPHPPLLITFSVSSAFPHQALQLRAEVASLETESNALRQQNRRLAARIIQLQVTPLPASSCNDCASLAMQPSHDVARQDLPQETLRLQQGVDSLSQQCRCPTCYSGFIFQPQTRVFRDCIICSAHLNSCGYFHHTLFAASSTALCSI